MYLLLGSCNQNKSKLSNNNNKVRKDSSQTAQLEFLNRRIDFGKVSNDTTLSGRFSFVNTGKKDLLIYEVVPDCSCTSFELSKKQIKPGDSAYIILNMATLHKFGETKIYSTVTANTPERIYSLEIIANVE
ncbi:MAG TPA: DUF1573 domain-containing protein [Niabella sp.]|nr:DUF1573 domain-containing protein [Niabella sp.]